MKKCKRCSSTKLKTVDDYQYEDGETDTIESINATICQECGCVHWSTDQKVFWEYAFDPDRNDYEDVVGNYATDFNVKAGLS
jgi:hypothetical protein